MMHQTGRIRFDVAWTGVLCVVATAAMAGDWPAFRGPNGNGVAEEDRAPLHWGPGKNVRWKATLPGPGNSSPIVSHGRVFKTCAEDAGKKRNLYCFDRRTGKELWARTVAFPVVEPMHKSNPYCASTPAADGARVVVWHGSAGVFCVDYPEWAFDPNAGGPRATPIARDGRLFTLGALTARSKNCCRYVATSPL